jgi:hypothetical protein
MQIHSLDFEDIYEDNYYLIGVHTTLEDYKLAYLLNQELKAHFSRATDSLDFGKEKNTTSYSIYNYFNATYDFNWFLISNSCKKESRQNNGLLLSSEIKNYLIPEKKNIDFFIKIIGESDEEFISKTVQKIKQIHQVITAYSVDHTTLKSKDFLIF